MQVLTKFCCFGQSMDFADNPKYVKRVSWYSLQICQLSCDPAFKAKISVWFALFYFCRDTAIRRRVRLQ